MNNLIKIENGTATLDNNVTKQIADFETQIKAIKKQEDEQHLLMQNMHLILFMQRS